MLKEIKIGSKVRLNIEVLRENGFCYDDEVRYNDIVVNEARVYTVKNIDTNFLAPIILDDEVLGITSFYEEEVILVE